VSFYLEGLALALTIIKVLGVVEVSWFIILGLLVIKPLVFFAVIYLGTMLGYGRDKSE